MNIAFRLTNNTTYPDAEDDGRPIPAIRKNVNTRYIPQGEWDLTLKSLKTFHWVRIVDA